MPCEWTGTAARHVPPPVTAQLLILSSPDVDDELVGAGAGGAPEQHGVVLLQPLGHVVGVQDGLLGGLLKGHEGE